MSDEIEGAARGAMAEAAPEVIDAIVKAFGEVTAREQAALLDRFARSLLTACESGWYYQADEVALKLDRKSREVFRRIGTL